MWERACSKGTTRCSSENPCQLTPAPRPCSPTHLVTGALHRVKRETGESCALLQAMSVRCCPRNGKRVKRQIHCANAAWEGDAGRFRLTPAPLVSPETGPQHKVTITITSINKPAVGGRCSDFCALGRAEFCLRSYSPLTEQREAPCRLSAAPATAMPPAAPLPCPNA
jgi:hypothetical protein